jgi:hypothetical protein
MADVEKETHNFFNLHWNAQQLADVDLPYSWGAYNFIGNVPYGDRQGCYALVRDNEIIYIGPGARRYHHQQEKENLHDRNQLQ